MLHVSGANKTLAIVLKQETTKKPAQLAVFSITTVDQVTVKEGKKTETVPLFGSDGATYHDTHPTLALLIDKALYSGPYAPTVLLSKGYISAKGFETMAKNVITQEASDRLITLDDGFDFAGAMRSAIVSRTYGKSPVLSLPSSEG